MELAATVISLLIIALLVLLAFLATTLVRKYGLPVLVALRRWLESRSRQYPQSLPTSAPELPVSFRASWPRLLPRDAWQTLSVYVLSGKIAEHEVARDIALQDFANPQRTAQSKQIVIDRGAELLIVPDAPGIDFNPRSIRVRWLEPWHRVDFRMHPNTVYGGVRQGRVSILLEALLIAQLAVEFDIVDVQLEALPAMTRVERSTAVPYRRIFVSYAHSDVEVIERLERAYLAIGDSYLRDIKILRSGQEWEPELRSAIDSADVFQLCWSKASQASRAVEQEWRHALRLRRSHFVRPVYWAKPLPVPPVELQHLHFTYVELADDLPIGELSTDFGVA
jgi:hypothetical protein